MKSIQEFGLTKPTYRSAEACDLLLVGRTKLWELVKSGQLKSRKCGRRSVFLAMDIAAYLSSLPFGDGK